MALHVLRRYNLDVGILGRAILGWNDDGAFEKEIQKVFKVFVYQFVSIFGFSHYARDTQVSGLDVDDAFVGPWIFAFGMH